jgi:7-carboxy-7-deazaguanine synthase
LKVNEIFASVQGEGPDCGTPAVFVRLSGCNVHCKWCDTSYALSRNDVDTPLQAVVDKIKLLTHDSGVKLVVVTGGEPLLQVDEVRELITLLHRNFQFAIETNGTQSIPSWQGITGTVVWDVDRKCPSSGIKEFNSRWYYLSKSNCRIKFVVEDENDLAFVVQELKQFSVRPTILVSPMISADCRVDIDGDWFNQNWLQRVWNFCVENNLRFSLQQHKIVWGNKKGV